MLHHYTEFVDVNKIQCFYLKRINFAVHLQASAVAEADRVTADLIEEYEAIDANQIKSGKLAHTSNTADLFPVF